MSSLQSLGALKSAPAAVAPPAAMWSRTASVISDELMAQYGIAAAVTIQARGLTKSVRSSQALTADELKPVATIGRHLAAFGRLNSRAIW